MESEPRKKRKPTPKQQQKNTQPKKEFLGISCWIAAHGDEVRELLRGKYSDFCSNLGRNPSSLHHVVPWLEVLRSFGACGFCPVSNPAISQASSPGL